MSFRGTKNITAAKEEKGEEAEKEEKEDVRADSFAFEA